MPTAWRVRIIPVSNESLTIESAADVAMASLVDCVWSAAGAPNSARSFEGKALDLLAQNLAAALGLGNPHRPSSTASGRRAPNRAVIGGTRECTTVYLAIAGRLSAMLAQHSGVYGTESTNILGACFVTMMSLRTD